MERDRPATHSDLDEKLVEAGPGEPDAEQVDSALAFLTDLTRPSGAVVPTMCFGWPPENFGYERNEDPPAGGCTPGTATRRCSGPPAQELRKGVGDTIVLQGEPFEVVGVPPEGDEFVQGVRRDLQ